MTNPDSTGDPDVIDEEAAEIDARSPEAPEQIAELIDTADDLGRDTPATPADAEIPDPSTLPASD